ncbi:MAG: glycosyltransferase family 9 protein [Candidatus Riflebacteria bacterium]|nr:glycosyltransferase family 9 protein [Candidatus Riflebacteria bacterium]
MDALHLLDVKAPSTIPAVVRELRSRRYELALDLQRLFKSGALAWLSGAPVRLGFDVNRARELSWLFTNRKLDPHDPQRHVVDQYLELARYLGIEHPAVEWRLQPPAAAREQAGELLAGGGRWAVLHLGAGKPANRWPAPGWAKLAQGLVQSLGFSVCLVGGADDRMAARAVTGLVPGGFAPLDLVGQTSLPLLMAVLERAAVVVSADSGPMHLAVALGRPVVALFGPANPLRTGPYGQLDQVVGRPDLWCAPCFRRRPCDHYECMPGIDAARVLARVRDVVG